VWRDFHGSKEVVDIDVLAAVTGSWMLSFNDFQRVKYLRAKPEDDMYCYGSSGMRLLLPRHR
jgi:hypothetical protein